MKMHTFLSFSEMRRFFGDSDEMVLASLSALDEQSIAEICRNAERRARQLRSRFGSRTVAEIADCFGAKVTNVEKETPGGGLPHLVDCTHHPPSIRLHAPLINRAAALAEPWIEDEERRWFEPQVIGEAMAAQGFYQMLAPNLASQIVEAPVFARALCALPFSPLLYQELVAQRGVWIAGAGH